MQKLVSSGKLAMDKILEGVNLVANPVKSTISPMGRTVIIGKSFVGDYNINNLPVEVTKDGYKVAMSIKSGDPEIQIGVQLIQEAAEKQMIDAGDATSTVCLLTQELLTGGMKLINDGVSHVKVVNGINETVKIITDRLKKISIPIDGDIKKVLHVATVCSNNDDYIGGLISEAFAKIGVDGVIDIEEAKGRETTIKISDGIKYPSGWASQWLVTNKSKSESVLDNPYILIYDRPLTTLKEIMPVLQIVVEDNNMSGKKRPLMILCDKIDGEALATLTYNLQQGNMQTCVTEMQWMGDLKKEFLEDIAAATGGHFINELKGDKLDKVKLSQLGQASKIVVGKDQTVIIGGVKNDLEYNSLVDSIKKMDDNEEDQDQKEKIKKRLARLTGAVAILSVGATTEVEMKEKKDRVDDAVRAVRSAIEMGIVAGGGLSFLKTISSKNLGELHPTVLGAIQKPLEQICINAGVDKKDILDKIGEISEGRNIGYNAKTGNVEDLIKSGIIEPVKSNICALQNAASVCCQILSSQFMITDTL